MAIKVGINGFGRIGRLVLRIGWEDPEIEFVAINDITTPATLAHLLKYDTTHGIWDHDIKASDDSITIDGVDVPIYAIRTPGDIPWSAHSADIIVEATGLFRAREQAYKHISAGAKKVLISAPGKDIDGAFIIGVNEKDYDKEMHEIISIGSCTTNGLVPVIKVLMDNFGVLNGLMTTIHAYTNDQRILDLPHKDLRRTRTAAANIIPTSTGAYKMAQVLYPELKGKFYGIAVRVPVIDGSLIDLNIELSRDVTAEEINRAFKLASDGQLAGILEYCEDPIVSSDIVGNPHSTIFDSLSTSVIGEKGKFAKLLTWYDNEYGFSNRMVDMLRMMI